LNFCLHEGQHFVGINCAAQLLHTEWPQGMTRGQWSLSLKLSKHTMHGVVITAKNGTSSAFFGIEKPPQEPFAYTQYVALYAAGSGGQGGGGSKAAAAAAGGWERRSGWAAEPGRGGIAHRFVLGPGSLKMLHCYSVAVTQF
jgi:hypothetical protein